jgi:hypothetical protein
VLGKWATATPGNVDEHGWSEYLLYNQKARLYFLVDAKMKTDLVKPVAGCASDTNQARKAQQYPEHQPCKRHGAETNYVAGRFTGLSQTR